MCAIRVGRFWYNPVMRTVLESAFFDRDPAVVARALLGMFVVRMVEGHEVSLMITETEAYAGAEDRASHARFGKTARTAPMFGPPSTTYVYFTYGMHHMLNVACQAEGMPSAVLIRGAGNIVGPARLTKALAVDRGLSGQPLGKEVGLWFEDRGVVVAAQDIQVTPRVGVEYAGACARRLWRFVVRTASARTKSAR